MPHYISDQELTRATLNCM